MAHASDIEFHATSQIDGELLADLRVDVMRESLEAVGRFDPDRARIRFLNSFDPETTAKIIIEGELTGFLSLKPVQTTYYSITSISLCANRVGESDRKSWRR